MSQSLSQQSTQAIIGIVFGIVMFILTIVTLWQGYRQKCRSTGAVITPGEPYAVTSDINLTAVEEGTYHRPTRSNRVILCKLWNAWFSQMLTADSLSHLLPHTKQWSKTFPNNRKQLEHTFQPKSLVTQVLNYCEPSPKRLLHHRSNPHHHLEQ